MNLFANIFNQQTQDAFSQTGQALKKSIQPLTDFGSQVAQKNVEAFKPAVQNIGKVVTKIAEPIIKPIEKQNKLNKVNNFISSKGITVDHIRALAEMDGTDPDEAIKMLRDSGIKVQGMDEIIKKEQEIAQQQAKGMLGSDKNREGFLENVVGVGADVVGGAVSRVPAFLGNTASVITEASQYNPSTYLGGVVGDVIKAPFSEKTYSDIRSERAKQLESVTGKLEGYGEKGKKLVQSTGLYDPTTTSAKVGETVADIGASFIGPNKVGAISSLGRLATPAKFALEGGIAGAKYGVASEGKINPTEVVGGALIGGALPAIPKVYQGSKSIVKNIFPKSVEVPVGVSKPVSNIIKKIVPDSFTPTELDNLKRSGQIRSGKGITGVKNTYIPSKEEIQIAEAITPHVKASATTTENIGSLRNAIKNEAESLKSAISSQNPIIPKKQVASHIKSALDKIMENPEMKLGENPKLVNRLIEKYKSLLDEEGGTAMGVLNARQRFDSYIKNFRPKTFDSPTGSVYDSAVREVRNSANDLLDSLVLNKSAKASLKLQSQMYNAIDMFARNRDITTLGKILKNPITKIAGGAALGSAGVGLLTGN